MILLDEGYAINVSDCYTFGKLATDKKGKTRLDAIGYYGTLEQALRRAREQYIADSLKEGELSLQDALTEIDRVNKRFDFMINGLPLPKGE